MGRAVNRNFAKGGGGGGGGGGYGRGAIVSCEAQKCKGGENDAREGGGGGGGQRMPLPTHPQIQPAPIHWTNYGGFLCN